MTPFDVGFGLFINLLVGTLSITLINLIRAYFWRRKKYLPSWLTGILFALMAFAGMLFPLTYTEGIIRDFRNVIIALSSFYGGPVAGLFSAGIASAYRLYIGGGGALGGILGLFSAAIIGILFKKIIVKYIPAKAGWRLPAFGLLIYFITFLWTLTLPKDKVFIAIQVFVIPEFILYPVVTFLFSMLYELETDRQTSMDYFRAVFRESPFGIIITKHEDNRVIDANLAFSKITGYDLQELEKIKLNDLMQEDFNGEDLSKNSNTKFLFKKKSGENILMSIASVQIHDQSLDKRYMIRIFDDITERSHSEEMLRKSEAKFRDLAEMLPEAVFETDMEMNINFINHQSFTMFGFTSKDFEEGLKIYDLLARGEREKVKDYIKKVLRTEEIKASEYNALKRDGSIFPILLHINLISDINKISGLRGVIIDLTEQKKMEKRIIESQKMESIGNLAGGIAHDFNNLLSPIIGFAELIHDDLPEDSLAREYSREIFEAAKKGANLVKQILSFSRKYEHEKMPVKLTNAVNEVIKLCNSIIPSNIELINDIQTENSIVLAEPIQLQQVLMNLITNAYQSIENEDGKIHVQLKEILLEDGQKISQDLLPGRFMVLTISDNGTGIDNEIINKIFDPYFTTKKDGKGTGLGLSVVYGIVKDMKGDIKVYSEKGKGSTFTIYIPLLEDQFASDTIQTEENIPMGSERILLVDDEHQVAFISKNMIESLGYTVSAFESSINALNEFNKNHESFDLIITDMTMPKMTGEHFAREVKRIKPGVPVIICSGFSERINKQEFRSIGVEGILMKPITKSEMAVAIRKVLDNKKDDLN